MFQSPGDIAFSIFGTDIYFYGLIMSFAMLVGILVICLIAKRYFKDINFDNICDLSFILIVFGIISARFYYVIMDYQYFIKHPSEILAIWNGGISIQGAIIGGIIAGYIYVKENNLNFFKYADLFVFGVIAGQAIGRWGNFFNSEAFGLPTQLPWKLYIPFKNRPQMFVNNEFFHPTFLYESILNILIFIILYIMLAKQGENKKYGIIFCSYLILYSIVRIIVETFRVDSVLNIGIFHIAHITSALTILFALIVLKKVLKSS